jgi:hypothetical protein
MNPRNFGLASGIGQIGAGLAGMFFGGDDPYDKAKQQYGKIPGATAPYYNPYINAGRGALGGLQDQYGKLMGNYPGLQGQYDQLMNDPNAILNKIGSGYHESPGFKWQLGQGMNAANNAAAAGGMAGTPQHQQQAATMAEGLANQDYWNFLSRGLGAYGMGLQGNQNFFNQGLEGQQGLNKMGFDAGDQMARIMADMYGQQGQLGFAGQAAQNQQQGANWGNIFGGLGAIAGFM